VLPQWRCAKWYNVAPLTWRGCPNAVGGASGIHLTSSEYNTIKASRFKDFCKEAGNEGLQAHLDKLHYDLKAWLAKHVANGDEWDGYPAHLLSTHVYKDGKYSV
jgi:hypothetical protein